MKTIIIAAVIALVPVAALGQAGVLWLSSDANYIDCHLQDSGAGLHPVYVIHEYTPGATAVSFRVVSSAGFAMTYVGETSPFSIILGNSQTGMCLAYGGCLASPILVVTVNYFGTGTSEVCSTLEVVPIPGTDYIEVVDCNLDVYAVYGGGTLFVNSDGSCDCTVSGGVEEALEAKPVRRGSAGPDFCLTLPVENGSWGHIKALYR